MPVSSATKAGAASHGEEGSGRTKAAKGSIKVRHEEGNCRDRVMLWFQQVNKPATPQFLTNELGSQFSKGVVQKTLETLHSENVLLAKDFKKIRIYYLRPAEQETEGENVPQDEPKDGSSEEGPRASAEPKVVEMEPGEREKLIREVLELLDGNKRRERQLQALRREGSARVRAERLRALQKEVDVLQEEENTAREALGTQGDAAGSTEEGAAPLEMSEAEMEDLVGVYRRARQLWSERKNLTERLLSFLTGDGSRLSLPSGAEDLYDLLGIVMDEGCGVSFKGSMIALPRRYLMGSTRRVLVPAKE